MSIHETARKEREAFALRSVKRAGYKTGGAVSDEEQDKKMIRKAVHKHEEHDHPGKPLTKIKKGGKIEGKKPGIRLDKRARGGSTEGSGGEEVYKHKPETEVRRPKERYINADAEPAPRARGGSTHGKGKGKTNIIIHAGGDSGQNPMALQQAKQQGEQEGAMKVVGAIKAKMAGAGAGGPPPGGMPPGGAPPGGPPPGMPPAMGPAAGAPPPMRKKGGEVPEGHVRVKGHVRRARGGKAETC
jgi:hypothetical protein